MSVAETWSLGRMVLPEGEQWLEPDICVKR